MGRTRSALWVDEMGNKIVFRSDKLYLRALSSYGVLKHILNKYGTPMCTGYQWFRLGSKGGSW